MNSEVEGIIAENKGFLAAYKELKGSSRTRGPSLSPDLAAIVASAARRVLDGMITERDGTDPRSHLTPQQLHLVQWIARGDDVATAMTREGVHPERGRRWLMTPRFKRAILRERARPATLLEQQPWSVASESEAS